MTTIGTTSRPAYVYDAQTDTWIPVGVGPHSHDNYVDKVLIDAKGDIFVGTAPDTVARLAVGAEGSVLVADPTAATGLAWNSTIDYETTVSSASTKTLTKDSPRNQFFTGPITGQIVTLPDTSTLTVGDMFEITNDTSSSIQVRTSTAASVTSVALGITARYTCVSTANNLGTAWFRTFEGALLPTGTTGAGNMVLGSSPTIATPALTLSTTASTTAGRLSVTGDNLRLGNGSTTLTFSQNPMTTAGDLIVGGASGAPARIGIGTVGQVLTSNGTTATWSAPTGGGGESISSFLLMGA
jgi:hypothetical protein